MSIREKNCQLVSKECPQACCATLLCEKCSWVPGLGEQRILAMYANTTYLQQGHPRCEDHTSHQTNANRHLYWATVILEDAGGRCSF